MSIDTVTEFFIGRGFTKNAGANDSAVRKFHVKITDPATALTELDATSLLPSTFSVHPELSFVWLLTREHQPLAEDRLNWIVTCTYGRPENGQPTVGDGYDYPWELPPVISFTDVRKTEVVERAYWHATDPDLDGNDTDEQGLPTKPIINAAGDVFDPPIMQDKVNQVIHIEQNIHTLNPESVKEYKNTVNLTSIRIAGVPLAPLEGLIRGIGVQQLWTTGGDAYWNLTFEIEVDVETHVKRVLNAGFYYNTIPGSGSNTKIHALDDLGRDVREPIKLLDDGGDGRNSDPVFLHFLTYFPKEWNQLPVPSDVKNTGTPKNTDT